MCHSYHSLLYKMSKGSSGGFSQIEDEILDTNQCALIISFNSSDHSITIERTANIPEVDSSTSSNSTSYSSILANLYLTASDHYATYLSTLKATPMQHFSTIPPSNISLPDSLPDVFTAQKKKYKPIAQKV